MFTHTEVNTTVDLCSGERGHCTRLTTQANNSQTESTVSLTKSSSSLLNYRTSITGEMWGLRLFILSFFSSVKLYFFVLSPGRLLSRFIYVPPGLTHRAVRRGSGHRAQNVLQLATLVTFSHQQVLTGEQTFHASFNYNLISFNIVACKIFCPR